MDIFVIDTTAFDFLEVEEGVSTGLGLGGRFYCECWGADGRLKWAEWAKNIIPNLALNNVLDVFYAQAANTAAFYGGIVVPRCGDSS